MNNSLDVAQGQPQGVYTVYTATRSHHMLDPFAVCRHREGAGTDAALGMRRSE